MDVKLTRRHVLFYDYVEDLVAKREPHRAAHLELAREWMDDGRLLEAGAYGDPPSGGLLVFASDDPADAEEFAGRDPYVHAGIVTRWRVEPWNVVS
jgi:uncharacterized protein YciI